MPPNPESPQTEQTAAEYLKSQTDIEKTKYADYLDTYKTPEKSKEEANLFKKNETFISEMENILKVHTDKIIKKGEQMDDNEAKMLIAYDALRDRYLNKKIPDNATERKIVALRIADRVINVKKFDEHENKDRYYNFMTNTYSENKNDNTVDLNLNNISIATGNNAIDSFISKNTALQQSLLVQKKNDRLNDIMNATRFRSENQQVDPNSPGALVYKQANDKQNSLWQENRQNNIYENMKTFENNPKQCMKLANILATNKDAFDTPINQDMVHMKDMFMDLVTSSYTNRKESNGLYRNREDLYRDNGISMDQNGNIIKEPAKLKNNNISLVVDGGNISIKNTITNVSLDVTQATFTK